MFKVEFSTDNAAFDEPKEEIRRILLKIEQDIADGHIQNNIRDHNGNTVGSWAYDPFN